MKDIKRENLDNLFEEYSEKFTYALGAKDDLEDLCKIIEYCLDVEDEQLIYRASKSLDIALNNVEFSPAFCSIDRENLKEAIQEKFLIYRPKFSKFFD